MVKRLRFDEVFLSLLALGNIRNQSIVTNQLPTLIASGNNGVADPAHLPALVDQTMFQRRRSRALQHLRGLLDYSRAIGWMDHPEPEVRIFVVIFRCVSSDRNTGGAVRRSIGYALIDLDGISIVGDRFEEVFVVALAFLESLFGPVAFNGVRDGTDQNMAVDLAFDEVVLGTFTNGFDRHGFVIGSAQNNDRHVRRLCVQSLEGFKPLAVRPGEIRENHVELIVAEPRQRVCKARHASPGEKHGLALAQQQLEQPRIHRAIFHQQYLNGLFHAYAGKRLPQTYAKSVKTANSYYPTNWR